MARPAGRGGVAAAASAVAAAPEVSLIDVRGKGSFLMDLVKFRGSFDVLHLNPSLRPRALARDLLAAKVWGGRTVFWFHGFEDRLVRSPLRMLLESYEVLVVSERQRSALARRNIPSRVVHPPVCLPAAVPCEPSHLLVLSRFEPGKGCRRVLRAYRELVDPPPLVMAGDGILWSELRGLAVGLDVSFPGWVGPSEKARLLDASKLLILASDEEGMPTAVLEALSRGVPVVSTNVGGVAEVLQPHTGLLVAGGLAHSIERGLGLPRGPVDSSWAVESTIEKLRTAWCEAR